jgi:tRNA nucleotidyltransferase (CCA-adding enzyme)
MLPNSILDPHQWFFDVELLPPHTYLVGGAVRDALLGRTREYLDLDFVLPEQSVETARRIADFYQAGFVVLDQKRAIARVVFPQGTLDFARQEGETLEKDLKRRDFTINAIAYNPCTREIIDPLKGCLDLDQQTIRMVSAANLRADPLRLLRAYRQAAQLGFQIETHTQDTIKELAPDISLIAAERVQMELGYLLSHPQGTGQLLAAIDNGLFISWLPETTINQGKFLPEIARLLLVVQSKWQNLEEMCADSGVSPPEQNFGYNWVSLAKLATLVSPFPEVAQQQLTTLKYSREVLRGATTILRVYDQWQIAKELSVRSQYFLFQRLGKYFPAWLLYALSQGIEINALSPLIDAYSDAHSSIAHPHSLVDGKELMRSLRILPSKLVGYLLQEIMLAQAEGRVSTPSQAIELAKEIISTKGDI